MGRPYGRPTEQPSRPPHWGAAAAAGGPGRQIAQGARGAPDDNHVLAVVDHAGRWLGAEAVAPGTLTPVAERAEQEGGQGFYVPATCRSVDEVRAMIDDYLSDV